MQRLLVCKQKELQGFMLFTPARLHVRQQKRQEAGYIQVSNYELNELTRIMRKAKLTCCVVGTVDSKMTNAAIGVEFKVGRYERYAHVVFPIEIAKENIDRNINQKSELLMEHLMKNVRKELEGWDEGDADTTEFENIMRLKMPFLLRKAVNMEYFKQLF